jgi:hypothetical protein
MLMWLARRAHDRAMRVKTVRAMKMAWFFRELASWARGGEWTAFPEDRLRRASLPRAPLPMIDLGGV